MSASANKESDVLVQTLSIQYAAMLPLDKFVRPTLRAILNSATLEAVVTDLAEHEADQQEDILDCTVRRATRFQPSASYRKRFLRALVEELEERGVDILKDIWCLCSEACQEDGKNGGFKTYFLSEGQSVVTAYQPYLLTGGTTGLTTWDAAYYMVEWMRCHPELLRGRKILELGAGSGLTGICLIKLLHPASYTFSDCHPDVLNGLRNHLRVSDLEGVDRVSVDRIDWEEDNHPFFAALCPDVILACDIAYDPALIDAFLRVLTSARSAADKVVRIFVCLKVRKKDTFDYFCRRAGYSGFRVLQPAADFVPCSVFPQGSYDPESCVVLELC